MSVLYSCVKLYAHQHYKLRNWASKLDQLHSEIKSHHMTLKFGRDQDVRALPLGEEVKLTIVGYARNEKIQCVQVEFDNPELNVQNKFPHITVSHTLETKPKESNQLLLETEGGAPVTSGVTLTGIVGYYRSGNDDNLYVY